MMATSVHGIILAEEIAETILRLRTNGEGVREWDWRHKVRYAGYGVGWVLGMAVRRWREEVMRVPDTIRVCCALVLVFSRLELMRPSSAILL
jgi:hypothetical protein